MGAAVIQHDQVQWSILVGNVFCQCFGFEKNSSIAREIASILWELMQDGNLVDFLRELHTDGQGFVSDNWDVSVIKNQSNTCKEIETYHGAPFAIVKYEHFCAVSMMSLGAYKLSKSDCDSITATINVHKLNRQYFRAT